MEEDIVHQRDPRFYIKENLFQLRNAYGLAQSDFAQKIGVSSTTYYLWESGKRLPKWKTIKLIAEHLGIDFHDLTESFIDENQARSIVKGNKSTAAATTPNTSMEMGQKVFFNLLRKDNFKGNKSVNDALALSRMAPATIVKDINEKQFFYEVTGNECATLHLPSGAKLICVNNINGKELHDSIVVCTVAGYNEGSLVCNIDLSEKSKGFINLKPTDPSISTMRLAGKEISIVGLVIGVTYYFI